MKIAKLSGTSVNQESAPRIRKGFFRGLLSHTPVLPKTPMVSISYSTSELPGAVAMRSTQSSHTNAKLEKAGSRILELGRFAAFASIVQFALGHGFHSLSKALGGSPPEDMHQLNAAAITALALGIVTILVGFVIRRNSKSSAGLAA